MQTNDKITGGWFYWDYDGGKSWEIWDFENNQEQPKAKVLDRPYPQMIAGTLPLFSYDAKEKIFSMEI